MFLSIIIIINYRLSIDHFDQLRTDTRYNKISNSNVNFKRETILTKTVPH